MSSMTCRISLRLSVMCSGRRERFRELAKAGSARDQTQAMSLRICDTGEMFEADERNSTTVYDKLSGVCRSDTDHQHNVDVRINVEKRAALLFSISSERDHVHSLQHRAKVTAAGKSSRTSYVCEVWAIRVEKRNSPSTPGEYFCECRSSGGMQRCDRCC